MNKYLTQGLLALILASGLVGCETLTPYQKMDKAVREGNVSAAAEVIRGGFRPDPREAWRSGAFLARAAEYSKKDMVELLLNSGYPVDAQDPYKSTAMLQAITYGKLDVVKLLLDRGADPNHMTECGEIPLGKAEEMLHQVDNAPATRKENQAEMVRLLKAKGASYSVKSSCNRTPLLKAALGGEDCRFKYERIARYYENDINATDCEGNTALHYAARYNEFWESFQNTLIYKGANQNVKNKLGYAPREYWPILLEKSRAKDQALLELSERARQAGEAAKHAEFEKRYAEEAARKAQGPSVWELNAEAASKKLKEMQADHSHKTSPYYGTGCNGSSSCR